MDATIARGPGVGGELEAQSDHAKYVCILVTGFLEQALVAIIVGLAEARSAPEISAYVDSTLRYWANPTAEKIIQLLGSFKEDWRKDLDGFLVDERKEAVNSLIALRNCIAHGESVGTSLGQVKGYYSTARDVIEHVATLVAVT